MKTSSLLLFTLLGFTTSLYAPPTPAKPTTPPRANTTTTTTPPPVVQEAEDPNAPVDPKKLQVIEFLKGLSDLPFTLQSRPDQLNDQEKATLEWLLQNLDGARKKKTGEFHFLLSRTRTDSSYAKTLKRHTEKGFPPLAADQDYIQLQYVPDGVSRPEYHGVIDLHGPKILSFWTQQ
jgi:hypothetical protein